MCHILSRYFWSVYGVFEQIRLVSDFADEARMYCFVTVRRSGTEMIYQTV